MPPNTREPTEMPETVIVWRGGQQVIQQAPWWAYAQPPQGEMTHKCLACSSKYRAKWVTEGHLTTAEHSKRVRYWCYGYSGGKGAHLYDAVDGSWKLNDNYKWTDSPIVDDAEPSWQPPPAAAPQEPLPAWAGCAAAAVQPAAAQSPNNDELANRIDLLLTRLETMERTMQTTLNEMITEASSIEQTMQTMEAQFADMSTAADFMGQTMTTMDTKLTEIGTRVGFMEQTTTAMGAKLTEMRITATTIETNLQTMEEKIPETAAGSALQAARQNRKGCAPLRPGIPYGQHQDQHVETEAPKPAD